MCAIENLQNNGWKVIGKGRKGVCAWGSEGKTAETDQIRMTTVARTRALQKTMERISGPMVVAGKLKDRHHPC